MVSCGVVIVICNTDKEISDDLGKMKIEDEGILICSFSRSIPPTDLVNSHGGVSGNASGDLIISFSHPTYRDTQSLKLELLEYIASLDRGANASSEQQDRVDQIARKLEAANKVKEPLESNLLNGKWELLYTTSQSILQTKVPSFTSFNYAIF
ncbi:hypothetical protein R6Q59_013269 [Mikania micrantha]